MNSLHLGGGGDEMELIDQIDLLLTGKMRLFLLGASKYPCMWKSNIENAMQANWKS